MRHRFDVRDTNGNAAQPETIFLYLGGIEILLFVLGKLCLLKTVEISLDNGALKLRSELGIDGVNYIPVRSVGIFTGSSLGYRI